MNKPKFLELLESKSLSSHCRHGHERTEENTYINPRGSLQCRPCREATSERFYKSNPQRWLEYNSKQNFASQREKAIQRDGEKCLHCGMTREEHRAKWNRDITVDHIDGQGRYSETKNNDIDNLQTLCLSCHGKKDGKRRKIEIE